MGKLEKDERQKMITKQKKRMNYKHTKTAANIYLCHSSNRKYHIADKFHFIGQHICQHSSMYLVIKGASEGDKKNENVAKSNNATTATQPMGFSYKAVYGKSNVPTHIHAFSKYCCQPTEEKSCGG